VRGADVRLVQDGLTPTLAGCDMPSGKPFSAQGARS
jgi:hypothetical protein